MPALTAYERLFSTTPRVQLWVELCASGILIVSLMISAWLPFLFHNASAACKETPGCLSELRPEKSWLPGGSVDLTDGQTREFRENLPTLVAFMIPFLIVSRLIRSYASPKGKKTAPEPTTAPPTALLRWYAAVGLVFIFVMHGSEAIFTIFTIFVVYSVTESCLWLGPLGVSLIPLAVWGATSVMRIGTEVFKSQLGFHWLLSSTGLVSISPEWLVNAMQLLDRYRGTAWWLFYPMLMLRLISFGMDAHWSAQAALQGGQSKDKSLSKPSADPWSYRSRVETPRPVVQYLDFTAMLAYTLYPPLYAAGPTTTFNAWLSHATRPQQSTNTWYIGMYAVRLCITFLLHEVMLHYCPMRALIRHNGLDRLDYVGLIGIAYTSIHFLWLKFLIIWRFFRLWALLDGVDTPENMNRCVDNNFSLVDFWRSWHRGFNQWLLRYIFVPLGGSRRGLLYQLRNIAVVFTFVALWHDMNPSLLAWAWLLAIFFAPELIVRWIASSKRVQAMMPQTWFRYAAGVACAGNIFILFLANLIGFEVGVERAPNFLLRLWNEGGISLILMVTLTFTCATQFMFLVRAKESEAARPKDAVAPQVEDEERASNVPPPAVPGSQSLRERRDPRA